MSGPIAHTNIVLLHASLLGVLWASVACATPRKADLAPSPGPTVEQSAASDESGTTAQLDVYCEYDVTISTQTGDVMVASIRVELDPVMMRPIEVWALKDSPSGWTGSSLNPPKSFKVTRKSCPTPPAPDDLTKFLATPWKNLIIGSSERNGVVLTSVHQGGEGATLVFRGSTDKRSFGAVWRCDDNKTQPAVAWTTPAPLTAPESSATGEWRVGVSKKFPTDAPPSCTRRWLEVTTYVDSTVAVFGRQVINVAWQ